MASRLEGAGKKANTPLAPRHRTPKQQQSLESGEEQEQYAEACQFFFEDEVFKLDRKGRVKFGVVTDTYSDTYSGDEEEDVDEVLNRGEVRVAFYPEGKEVVQLENVIGLADRTLLPGDVVRRIVPGKKSTSGQSGYVREVNMSVDVRVMGTKYVIKNVPCERLRTLSPWSMDTAVCLDSWVGSTVNVEERAILKTSNGARIEIGSNDFYRFKDLNSNNSNNGYNTSNVFYPGNVVVGRLPALDRFRNLTPEVTLNTNKKGRPIASRYTVESVYTESVSVMWQCKAIAECAGIDPDSIQEPEECIRGESLNQMKRLNLFESCMLQIHDRSYLKFSKCDKLIKYSEWEDEKTKAFQAILRQQHNAQTQTSPAVSNGVEVTNNNAKGSKSKKSVIRNILTPSQSSSSSQMQIDGNHSNKGAADTLENMNSSSTADSSATAAATVPTPRLNPRHSKRRHVKKKMRSLKRTLTAPFIKKEVEPKDGEEVVVEALIVYSAITVVWQDGTIEAGIPSTQLFPIHHLDNHEFFPGDYVCKNTDELQHCLRDYGIVQHVDHDGRTGVVKWFTTYVNTEKPVPTYNGQTEVSVYDLKDHPDFQYRPGTMVIRVANFAGEDANSTAGQIIDNYPDGRIKVWWVNGHITMCYPQDLFEVSQFDHDAEYESDEDSEDSWETESEESQFGSEVSITSIDRELHILAGIDSAKDAMKRLQSIIRLTQEAQKPEVIKDLLAVYKNCRYLDRLLHTNFFHEDNFQGIVRRKKIEAKPAEATTPVAVKANSHLLTFSLCGNQSKGNDFSPKVIINLNSRALTNSLIPNGAHEIGVCNIDVTSPTNAIKRKCSFDFASRENQRRKNNDSTITPVKVVEEVRGAHESSNTSVDKGAPKPETKCPESACTSNTDSIPATTTDPDQKITDDELIVKYKNEYFDILSAAKANIAKAFERNYKHKCSAKNDSGNYTRTENTDESIVSHNSSKHELNCDTESNSSLTVPSGTTPTQKSVSNTSIELTEFATPDVCEVFCFLINEQMEKCRQMIDNTYCRVNEKKKLRNEDGMEAVVGDSEHSDASSIASTEEMIELNAAFKEVDVTATLPVVPTMDPTEDGSTIPSSAEDAGAAAFTAVTAPNTVPMARSSPITPAIVLNADESCFELLAKAPTSHRHYTHVVQPVNRQQYQRAVQREYRLLRSSLPAGVKVRVYENRMDLLSVMMEGPKNTPYEQALFFFDIQLVQDYPKSPPGCLYLSYCSDRLNPNLYEEGKVCVSLLGTWTGRDTEVWSSDSTLLQVLVSIQGLILVDEPYYNEAGYEKQRGSQHGQENSRMYNEMAVIKVLQSTIKQLQAPPEVFRAELQQHFLANGLSLYERIKSWVELSEEAQRLKVANPEDLPKELTASYRLPAFPFLPCSRGCCLALTNALKMFKSKLDSMDSEVAPQSTASAAEEAIAVTANSTLQA